MAKTNIIFNNKNYSIDDVSLSAATAALKSHMSTVMNGTGAVINLGGVSYNVDATKLANARNEFIAHLGTIPAAGGSGNGFKVVVNGVTYTLDSSKIADAISDLEVVFGGLNNPAGDSHTITWDGNTDGKEFVNAFNGYKISDEILTIEDLLNAEIYLTDGSITFPTTMAERKVTSPFEGALMCSGLHENKPEAVFITTIDEVIAGQLGASAGTYFSAPSSNGGIWVCSLIFIKHNQ